MNQPEKMALALGALGLGGWWLYRSRMKARYSFANKVVLVTGGSRGLGLVVARELASQGARVTICARDDEELQRAGHQLAIYGTVYTSPCDVTDPDQVNTTVRAIENHLGPVDVLINNAGIIGVGPLDAMTRADFEQALAVNFWGAYNMVEAVLPGMRRRHSGRIVNISSIGGKISIPHLVPYCVGKFALVGYSHGLRAELARYGITVTTICPGLMRTGSPRNASFKGKYEAEYAWFKISDSLPLLTISAEHAAHDILEACRRGDAEAVLSLPAQFGVMLQSLFPELTAGLTSLANRLLPGPGGIGSAARLGKESESALSSSVVTALTDRAAVRNNEMQPSERE